MPETRNKGAYAAPAHVPPELVRPWRRTEHPSFLSRPFEAMCELHDGPDIFYSPVDEAGTNRGTWVCTRAEQFREVLQNPDIFCNDMSDRESGWPRRLIPLELDPPEHTKYRALLAPIFSPRAIDRMEGDVRRITDALIGNFAERGHCEFNTEFARPLPVTIFMGMMGLPEAETDRFVAWEEQILHATSIEENQRAGKEIAAYLAGLIEQRRREPRGDIVSLLTQAEVDGKPIPEENVQDMCMLLFMAGLDTVTIAMGHVFRYLAEHPEARRQLISDPGLIPSAVEELLRYHAFVGSSRKATRDTEILGVKIKAGDWVNCPTILASRDKREFSEPDNVNFTREPNPHVAFSGGPHRCVGSHLARRELRVAVEHWLKRIPEFRIPEGADIKVHQHGMIGLTALPLEWDVK